MRRRRRIRSSFEAISSQSGEAIVFDIGDEVERNRRVRNEFWTSENMQVIFISLNAGEELGIEVHENSDQFIKIESGRANVFLGNSPDDFFYQRTVDDDFAIIIPAGTWHNISNASRESLKLYTIYAPRENEEA